MTTRLRVGDHVTWNSEVGHVSGRIIKVHTKDIDYKGHTHHASVEDPQYEIAAALLRGFGARCAVARSRHPPRSGLF
ncbi:DUF2945 domain-containing protein [Cupriavidus necator]|uniref:DUF2945 domain-containing protein n=1 Tax=Cupriavidus necator TaxID=106590 RepID=UPI00129E4E89|nr:DUF2945 domain-containing protein [Cupriavidus necator]